MRTARWWAFPAAAGAVLLAATVLFGIAGPMADRRETTPQRPAVCGRATGPFRVRGSRVIGKDGRVYVPYGITVAGLAYRDYRERSAQSQVAAAAQRWCVNTVRVQVAQSDLIHAARPGEFLSAVESVVGRALGDGLIAVISDQTEKAGHQPAPTAGTIRFWNRLAAVYGRNWRVVFDLFNEPRAWSPHRTALDWRIWRDGGTYRHHRYVGMQQVVTAVRRDGATNLLWVEGPDWAGTLRRVGSHLITGGGPLMYDVHHPDGWHDPASWARDFGYLVTRHIAPVVDGEWTNYAAARPECWRDAHSTVPRYLSYLGRLGIGMTAWTLRKDVLVEANHPTDPTRIRPNWTCARELDEGAGSVLLHWYEDHNRAFGNRAFGPVAGRPR